MIKTLITPEEISLLARPCYADEEKALAYIVEAEQNNIKPAIGDDLFIQLKEGGQTFLLEGGIYERNGKRYELNGIKRALAYFVISRLYESSTTELTRQGVVNRRSEYSDNADERDIISVSRETYAIANRYMEEIERYLGTDVKNTSQRVHFDLIGGGGSKTQRTCRPSSSGGSSPSSPSSNINVVQVLGDSTKDVISQAGVTREFKAIRKEIESNTTDIQYLLKEAVKFDSFEVEKLGDGIGINFDTFNGHGSSVEIPAATTESAGVMSAEDKKVLDVIDAELLAYEHRTMTGETSVEIDGISPKSRLATLTLATRNILLLPYDNVTNGTPSYDYSPFTVNGMTFTPNRDGSIKLNGTATAQITLWVRSYHKSASQNARISFQPGTYTASIKAPGAGANVRFVVSKGNHLAWEGNPKTFTYSEETLSGILLQVINGFTADNLYVYPQIETGSVATPFQTPLTRSIDQSETPSFPNTNVIVSQDADTEFSIENGRGTIELSGRDSAIVTSEYPFTLSLSYEAVSGGGVIGMVKKAFSSAVGESVQRGFLTTFNSNDSISLISTMAKKNKTLTFFATIGTMGSIRFLHGEEVYNSGDVTIDGTNIVVRTYATSYTERLNMAHGLTMKDYIAVTLFVGDTNNLSIVIKTNGGTYTKDNIFFSASHGDVSAKAISGSYSNASVSWVCDSFRYPVWMFGDSYLDTYNPARWPKYIVDAGFPKFFASGYPGGTSFSTITDFRESIKHGNPKYLLWALGMNDADRDGINQSWLECVQEVISTCDNMGIVPILATIPNCPKINHTYKNAWVKASGYRYVDFAEAVGASSFPSSWYEGMLNTAVNDNVHPLEPGAIALAYRVLADMPEITRCK